MALRLATMLVALALSVAAPTAALAQGAGDDQYSDPFGSGQNDDSGSGDDDAQPEPSQPAEPAPAPDPAPEATASQQEPAGQDQLPYTGADEGLVALAGGMLLVGGVALRVRVSGRARRL